MGRIRAKDLERVGAAGRVEPLAAAINVPPAFEMNALGVFAHKEVVLKIAIGRRGAFAFKMRLTACVQVSFVGIDAAIGAMQDQHGQASIWGVFRARARKLKADALLRPPRS